MPDLDALLFGRASRLFDELIDRSRSEREAALHELEGSEPALAREVRRWLAADARSHSALDDGGARFAGVVLEQSETRLRGSDSDALAAASGDRLGPWRLVERIGLGGMGEVWSAERADGAFELRVAVKLLKRGLETDRLLARFRRERQILGRLVHPGIARLLDAGATPDGRPYFVMEWVEGRSITEWAHERSASLEDRLRRVRQVATAVDFAHRNLVVHRDLKPSNVLVDERGEVKLLDFGIAKLLEQEEGETQWTELEARALTPAYAAPEQIRGEPVTTATDVYALGVVLYEMLTGRLPHRRSPRSLAALVAEVESETVEKPSVVVARSSGSLGSSPTEVERSARRLAGDLDTIALKALAREPERRYSSAAAMADDLDRYLGGLPVAARPDRFGYRAGKFVRRHAVGVAAVTATVALVALLTGAYTLRLARERDRSALERRKAERVAGFLTGLFELTDLDQTKGEKLSVRDIVDRGAANLERELAGEPEIAATLERLIGNVYAQLDLKSEARPLLEGALERRRALFGGDHVEVAESERDLGVLMHELGEHDRAIELLRDSLAIEERARGPESVEGARTRTLLARVLRRGGGSSEALAELARARQILERAGEAGEVDLALTLSAEGLHYLSVDEPQRALVPFERALEIRERRLGSESPTTAASLLNLGAALRETGGLAAAVALDERALALTERLYGADHTMHAYALGELGLALQSTGDAARAGPAFERAIAIFTRVYGPEDSSTLLYRRSLAAFLAASGRSPAALSEHSDILAIRERVLPASSPRIAESLFDVAGMRLAAGERGPAIEAMMRRGIAIFRARLGEESVDLQRGLATLGGYLCAAGRGAEGRAMLEQAASAAARNPSPSGPQPGEIAAALERCVETVTRPAS